MNPLDIGPALVTALCQNVGVLLDGTGGLITQSHYLHDYCAYLKLERGFSSGIFVFEATIRGV